MSDRILASGQLGPTLRALREAQGWSQAALGQRLGLSQERISAIERRPERITVEQLLAVLMALEAELSVRSRPSVPVPAPW
ncbi:MAG: helix-turn-helix domain-containing protein [Burkholderiaceae bacterium]|nr:helix-turn-helix domain-containing protein [Burkholderiaceae bacterium]